MVRRDEAFSKTAPKVALSSIEVLAKVEHDLRNVKTPALSEYGIRGTLDFLED